jgi:hypothetical protein
MDLLAFPTFHDLKMKSGQEGGFSDGGVVCGSIPLTLAPVDVAPVKGTGLGAFSYDDQEEFGGVLTFWNFDLLVAALVNVYFVLEDGSEQLLIAGFSITANTMAVFPLGGLCITHPNKLRFKLTNAAALTGLVRLKTLFMEYDTPSDLD